MNHHRPHLPFLRHALLTLVLCLSALAAGAQSAYQLIEQHRQWMRDHYPKAERLSEQELTKEAAFTIYEGLREPEAMELLKVVGTQVPAVKTYVEGLSIADPGQRRAIQALQELHEHAIRQLGKEDDATGWCHWLWLMADNNYEAFNIALAARQVSTAKHQGHQLLDALFRLGRFLASENVYLVCTPDLYTDVLMAERELTTACPSHAKASIEKAYAYHILGQAKRNMTLPYEAEEAYRSTNTPYDNSYSDDNKDNGKPRTNADHYFAVASDTYISLGDMGRPAFIDLCADWGRSPVSPAKGHATPNDNIAAHALICDYTKLYCNPGNALVSLRALQFEEAKVAAGQKPDASFVTPQLFTQLEEQYGATETNLFWLTRRYASMAARTDTSAALCAINEGIKFIRRQHRPNNVRAAMMLWLLFHDLQGYMPTGRTKAYEEASAMYKRFHDSSVTSCLLGNMLSECGTQTGMPPEQTYALMDTACQDLEKHYGAQSPIYLNYKAIATQTLYAIDSIAARKQMANITSLLDKAKANPARALEAFAYTEYKNLHYQRAAVLFDKALKATAHEGKTQHRAHLMLGRLISLKQASADDQELERLYRQATSIMDHSTDPANDIVDNYYIACKYLEASGKWQEAFDMASKGVALCERRNELFTQEHISLITTRYGICYNQLNNKHTAYKLMTKDLDQFERQGKKAYTIEALNYLCEVFNYYDQKYDDYATWFRYFYQIGTIFNTLASQNKYDNTFMLLYWPYILSKATHFSAYFSNLRSKYDITHATPEQRKAIEAFFTPIDELSGYISTIDTYFEEAKYDFPNLAKQFPKQYLQLLEAAEDYHTQLKPNFDKAKSYLVEHLAWTQQAHTAGVARAWTRLGDLYLSHGDYDKAKQAFDSAASRLLADPSITVDNKAAIQSRLLTLCQMTADPVGMWQHAQTLFSCLKELYDGEFLWLTQKEQDYFVNLYGYPAYWPSTSLVTYPDKQQIAGTVYDDVLYSSGLQLRSRQTLQRAIAHSGDKKLKALLKELHDLQSKHKKHVPAIDQSGARLIADTLIEMSRQQTRINLLERQIMERALSQMKLKPQESVSWQQVRDKLAPGEAAIEMIYADPYYMALLLKPGCNAPIVVRLANGSDLLAAINALGTRTSAATAQRLYGERAVDLYSMLWQPMENELQGVSRIYYATQGLLATIAFAAIATPDGRYLIDHYDLRPLTTTALLLKNETTTAPKSMVAMGDIFYCEKQNKQVAQGDIRAARGDDDRAFYDFSDEGQRASKRYHFKYLPYTKEEMESIETSLSHTKKSLRRGLQATERQLKELLVKAPSVVHLATHGFYIPEPQTARTIPFFQRYGGAVDNPLQRAGIALADAEDTWTGRATPPEEDDGIVTANEVAQLNLQGTQLVTLSACETALGAYSFDGVQGLTRGFKQAGVESMLVSLWSVNDKSTAMLMSSFYQYWSKGETKQQAFKHAVTDVRQAYPQPYYWAPFVLLDAVR